MQFHAVFMLVCLILVLVTGMHGNAHLLDGINVSGHVVRVESASAQCVTGKLINDSGKGRRELPFVIDADEKQFNVPAVIQDIRREFSEFIQQ